MESTVWLTIFSTLFAISAFTAGILFQLRTVNYHTYATHCLNYFSHYESAPIIAEVYRRYSDSYRKIAQNAISALKIALVSMGLVGIGWLSIVICSITESFGQECICTLVVYIILFIVAILFLVLSVATIAWYHKDHISDVVDHETQIKKMIDEIKKDLLYKNK